MKEAAKTLNIKGHNVGQGRLRKLYAPADIECHLGKDGRYYVLGLIFN